MKSLYADAYGLLCGAVVEEATNELNTLAATVNHPERAKRIAAMIEQGCIEGAYRHLLDHKDAQASAALYPHAHRKRRLASRSDARHAATT